MHINIPGTQYEWCVILSTTFLEDVHGKVFIAGEKTCIKKRNEKLLHILCAKSCAFFKYICTV